MREVDCYFLVVEKFCPQFSFEKKGILILWFIHSILVQVYQHLLHTLLTAKVHPVTRGDYFGQTQFPDHI